MQILQFSSGILDNPRSNLSLSTATVADEHIGETTMYHFSIETVRECISRQSVVTDDLRKFERELGPEGLIHVTRLQSAFGTYVVGIEPAPSGKLCGHCGGAMPVGRSCDCFDNNCQ